ncbi:hypothetical protein IQ37_11180 [Chryseobacterium piperi]|uniref:LytTR family transcriptional regulator n=1 Tax=Chryseobacterium piperi TaxID=558152 RepID=A0A086BCR9_9FLAO|nr:LytTR family DNA-binding domain-containing protein [Chryseobacterium piperi]ASW73514.1 DNA-binding response regulator [Chryseobacterium piperi]KFF26733.1 hypothetical protein IQ37_11180 [Chryseobacterium piperi]
MTNILIVEDEGLNAEKLIRILKELRPNYTVLTVLESVEDSVNWFQSNPHPDLVFMDIRLLDGLSFEIFEQVTIQSSIIFTTAFDEYAVEAFKQNSIGYILKPVEKAELEQTILKWESQPLRSTDLKINKVIESLSNHKKEFRSRFLIPFRDKFISLPVSDIAHIYSESKITRIVTYDCKEYIINQTLEVLERELDPKFFFRVNRQYIVHISAILEIYNYYHGKLRITLKNNPELEIFASKEKSSYFKDWLDF